MNTILVCTANYQYNKVHWNPHNYTKVKFNYKNFGYKNKRCAINKNTFSLSVKSQFKISNVISLTQTSLHIQLKFGKTKKTTTILRPYKELHGSCG
jgi:hypothetical protein